MKLRFENRFLDFSKFSYMLNIWKRKNMGQVVNVAKYKKNNEINAIAKHNLRCYIPTNVDGDRTASNTYFAGNAGQVGISRIVTEALKDIPHRKRCKQGCQPCFQCFK